MKDIFKLYINGQLVDFEQEPAFPVTYQQEDFSNPTIIKNNFSKTIKIEGTDNNNRIFGEIYNLEREQLYKIGESGGAYFDPSKRTPFALYKNSELLDSGYMQMTSIAIKNWKVTYNITLYGGLGDFFYSLMYNDDGEKKTLADLYYKIKDEYGSVLPKSTELDFVINKDFVNDCWNALNDDNSYHRKEHFISFAPAYNGLYDDFDNSSICVNTQGSAIFTANTVTDGGVTYTAYEGYKMANTDKEFTEWEVRDLRSYMQRPCIRFRKLFEALCDEDNNGGYKVNLDNTFFNEKNPYYEKAYMALPLLPSIAEGSNEEEEKDFQLYLDTNYYNNYAHIGYYNNTLMLQTAYRLAFDGDELSATATDDFKINMDNVPITSTFDVKLDFDLEFVAESLNETMDNENLYLSNLNVEDYWTQEDPQEGWESERILRFFPNYKSIIVQAYMYDSENPSAPQYYSNVLNFTNEMYYDGYYYVSTPNRWINNNDTNKDKYTYTNVFGSFKRQGNTKVYKWVSGRNSKFYLDIKDIPRKNNMAIALSIKLMWSKYNYQTTPRFLNNKPVRNVNGWDESYPVENTVKGYATLPLYDSSALIWYSNTPTVRSGTKIKKNVFLKTEFSPCDVLLDYCKLFGLYFTKDIHSKTINIMTKNTFFNGNVIDISNRIDYTQEMTIKPYLFETKYYLMKSEANDSYYSKKYNNEYNLIYGQKRIDTNYNFNKDTQDVYEGSVFQNAISATDTSPYYRTFLTNTNKIAPSWLLANPKIELYNGVGTNDMKTYEEQYLYNKYININLIHNWNIKSGYDMFPKTCFYTLDNNSKSLNDINSTLLFFNGFVPCVDVSANPKTVPFWLSDDVYPMSFLNDNDMCYLYTEVENDMTGKHIAYKKETLPQFIRYYTNSNNITDAFDFGKPKEIYIPNLNYSEDATLYNKFWKNYLEDRYNVNTKKVTCYVNLEGMKINQESMKSFYYFNNTIWAINKIENYFPNSYKTTKVEFVKVNDTNNYLNAQHQYGSEQLILSETSTVVDATVHNYNITLTATTSWSAYTTTPNVEIDGNTSGDTGVYEFELDLDVKNEEYPITTRVVFEGVNTENAEFTITQLPSPRNSKLLYGYVYDKETEQPFVDYEIYFRNSYDENTYTTEKIVTTNEDGYFETYLGKSLNDGTLGIWVHIYNTNGDMIYQNLVDWYELKTKERRDFVID